METLDAWSRAEKPLGTPEMVRLLQSVTHWTEHAIIFRVKGENGGDVHKGRGVEVDVANGHHLPWKMWDAPHQVWHTIPFLEAFK